MRKKTSSKDLSKRAKNLVRKWKGLVDSRPSSAHINGERIDVNNMNVSSTHMSIHSNGLVSPSAPQSPSVFTNSNNHSSNGSEKMTTPPSPAIGSSKHSPSLPIQSSQSNHIAPDTVNSSKTRPVQLESLSKTNAANKKRRRTDSSANINYMTVHKRHCTETIIPVSCAKTKINGIIDKHHGTPDNKESVLIEKLNIADSNSSDKKGSIKTDADRLRASMKPQKVKTTAQLIQDLSSKSGVNVSNGETAAKIALNQIQKEPDPIVVPVVPPGAKPRPRRKPGTSIQLPPQIKGSMSQTKKELVHKFLETSVSVDSQDLSSTDIPSRAHSPIALDGDSSSGDDYSFEPIASTSKTPPDNNANEKSLPLVIDPWALLPPINYDIDWTSDEYNVNDPEPVSDQTVNRLHDEEWNGVNGQYDSKSVFHSWTRSYSVLKVVPKEEDKKEEQDYIHILPYVNI